MTACAVGLLIRRLCVGLTVSACGDNKLFAGGRKPGTASWCFIMQVITSHWWLFFVAVGAIVLVTALVRGRR